MLIGTTDGLCDAPLSEDGGGSLKPSLASFLTKGSYNSEGFLSLGFVS